MLYLYSLIYLLYNTLLLVVEESKGIGPEFLGNCTLFSQDRTDVLAYRSTTQT